MIRARFTRGRHRDAADREPTTVLEIEPGALGRVFVAPRWLRDAGIVAWLIVGIVLVLVVTIGGRSLFGMIGLVLAAPVTSAIVRITHDLTAARPAAEAEQEAST